jgi:hypothetical protein
MNYALEDQNVIVTVAGVPHRVNIGSMDFSLDNEKYTTKTDNALGEIIFVKNPGWKNFTATLNIPQSSQTNDFLNEVWRFGLTCSFTWKNNGSQVVSSNKCKINLVSSGAQTDSGDTVWKVLGKLSVTKMGGAGEDLIALVLPTP